MIATSGSASLPYDVHGSAPDAATAVGVLLLHAGVNDRRAWGPMLPVLGPEPRVVAFDARGYGESSYAPEPFSPKADALAVMDAAGLERAVLVGCSIGGRTAIDLALDHPERVAALVLIAAAIGGAPEEADDPPEVVVLSEQLEAAEAAGDLDEVNRLEARCWLDGLSAPESRVTGPARDLFLTMNRQALGALPTGHEDRTSRAWQRLGEIAVPTLVLVGDLDLAEFQDRSEEAARRIPHARFVRLRGVAHLPILEADPACLTAISQFLESVRSAP